MNIHLSIPPSLMMTNDPHEVLQSALIETILGPMVAIANDEALYLLEFVDRRALKRELEQLCLKKKINIVPGTNTIIQSIALELTSYFGGTLQKFNTPVCLIGTPFQKIVWEELLRIPYGQTRSYATQAESVGKKGSYRAVANANGANQLAIIIPCHRIIHSNGNLGGYGGGIARKQWMIDHEKKYRDTLESGKGDT